MSIRSAAGSRAGGRPVSVYHAVAPSSSSSGSYLSSISRPESVHSGTTLVGSDDYDSYYSRSSDGGSEIMEEHHSAGPSTSSAHHLPHDEVVDIHSHVRDLEEGIAHTRQLWGNEEINPHDMLSVIANHKRELTMVASPNACRDPSLRLRFDRLNGALEELEQGANIRKMREQEEMESATKEAERRENEWREELERRQRPMQEKAGEKERIRNEKEVRKQKKAEEEKQRRIVKEQKRKEEKIKFAAAMKEKEKLEEEKRKSKEEQRVQKNKKVFDTRKSRDKAARDRDMQRKEFEKKVREEEELARYKKGVADEDRRYRANIDLQRKARLALGNREEESEKRKKDRANAFAKKVKDDRKKKLEKEFDRLEERKRKVGDDLGYRGGQ
ncbi:hypothetical protein EAE96_009623 [Botrytis aclada]|nr:hypothetical protein EAE96_009623 [Botrytis aclada]